MSCIVHLTQWSEEIFPGIIVFCVGWATDADKWTYSVLSCLTFLKLGFYIYLRLECYKKVNILNLQKRIRENKLSCVIFLSPLLRHSCISQNVYCIYSSMTGGLSCWLFFSKLLAHDQTTLKFWIKIADTIKVLLWFISASKLLCVLCTIILETRIRTF